MLVSEHNLSHFCPSLSQVLPRLDRKSAIGFVFVQGEFNCVQVYVGKLKREGKYWGPSSQITTKNIFMHYKCDGSFNK